MAFRFDNFDADQVVVSQPSFELIPNGTKCWFELIEADVVPTSKGGQQLTYTAEIKAPEEYASRKVWGRINIDCPSSAEAEKIGVGQLAALCKAIGISKPSDTNDLLGQPFEGTIGIKRGEGINPKNGEPFSDQNTIKYYKPLAAAAPSQPAARAAPRPAPAAAAQPAKKPWERAA